MHSGHITSRSGKTESEWNGHTYICGAAAAAALLPYLAVRILSGVWRLPGALSRIAESPRRAYSTIDESRGVSAQFGAI